MLQKIIDFLNRFLLTEPSHLSVEEFEYLVGKALDESYNDRQIDNCLSIINRYEGIGYPYDQAIKRLYRKVILMRYKISIKPISFIDSVQLS